MRICSHGCSALPKPAGTFFEIPICSYGCSAWSQSVGTFFLVSIKLDKRHRVDMVDLQRFSRSTCLEFQDVHKKVVNKGNDCLLLGNAGNLYLVGASVFVLLTK